MKVIQYKRGSVITEPGLYAGVPIDVYHGPNLCDGPSISSSGLRRIFSESPAHYWSESPYNPDRVERSEPAHLVLGRAAHHLLLGEDDFSTLFIVRPEEIGGEKWQGNRTVCKKWLAEQRAEGRTVLTPDQIDVIRGMARSLAAHPLIDAGILNGAIEHTMVWRDKETGIWKKARPDATPNDSGDFADLKTTTSVQREAIERTIADFGYHAQGALICEGYHTLTGNTASTFTLVFAEKAPPFCVRVVTLKDDDLARGERQNAAATKLFAGCMASGEWPGPGDNNDAEYVSLPPWEQKKIDDKLELMGAA